MATLKQRVGKVLFSRLPVSRHVFDHVRLELNAMYVRACHRLNPLYLSRIGRLKAQRGLLVNLGCGPFGKPQGWVNLDLHPIENVYLRTVEKGQEGLINKEVQNFGPQVDHGLGK